MADIKGVGGTVEMLNMASVRAWRRSSSAATWKDQGGRIWRVEELWEDRTDPRGGWRSGFGIAVVILDLMIECSYVLIRPLRCLFVLASASKVGRSVCSAMRRVMSALMSDVVVVVAELVVMMVSGWRVEIPSADMALTVYVCVVCNFGWLFKCMPATVWIGVV